MYQDQLVSNFYKIWYQFVIINFEKVKKMGIINLKYVFDCNELCFKNFKMTENDEDFDDLFQNYLLVQTVVNKKINELI